MNKRRLARLAALTELNGIGDKRAIELYEAFESLDELYQADLEQFDSFHYVDKDTFNELRNLQSVVETYEERFVECEEQDIEVIGIEDGLYPDTLRKHHSPPLIYGIGNTELLQKPSVSFSGSRETSEDGQEWTNQVAQRLAGDYVIVSGGALGVDTAAHTGALAAGGETIVVLGTGVENPYPNQNEKLFKRIVSRDGLLISHRSPDAGPSRSGFLHRNKTSAALSEAIIIVATDGSGGTMSQYSDAMSQGQTIFVPLPELALEPTAGIRDILDDETAVPVTSAGDIIRELNDTVPDTSTIENQSSIDEWS